jgi:aminoglycoside 3-N-acetyltransferase
VPALRDWKRRTFPKGVRRVLDRYRKRLFERTRETHLVRALERLELAPGSVVCVHARLSSFGYLVDGPESIIRAVRRAIPDSTVLMPTFPFGRTMLEYVEGDPLYDPATTPSASGLLSEAFRRMEGVRRSLHPTHPCAALGPRADALVDGSEKAATPFGDESSYGRFCLMDEAVQLLFDTNSTSIVHRVQEVVGMPNLFLPGTRTARGRDRSGRVVRHEVVVHTPRIPLFIAVPGGEASVQYVWMPDYCVLFPSSHRATVLAGLRDEETRRRLAARDDGFFDSGVFRRTKHRNAEILAFHAKPWLDAMCAEMKANLERFAEAYDADRVRADVVR